MNISVDILIEYNRIQNKQQDIDDSNITRPTCLSMNDLVQHKEYTLELDDADVKEGFDFFQDLISKLDKIAVAINANVQIEENKKIKRQKPNWDKIQELR